MGTPAYLAKRRESSILKSTTNDNVSLLSIDEQQSVSTSPMFEVYGHKILKADIEILESQSGWLNDSLINPGLNMLRSQFPGSSGLYVVSLANTLCYPDETHEDFIQILNVRHSHWVCASNKSCNAGTVKIYDSLRTGDIPLSAKEVISALLHYHYQKKKVTLIFPDVQQQSDGSACGVFALAYAYTLCQGEDPVEIQYDVLKMRPHFLSCLQKGEFTVFPSVKTRHMLFKTIMTSFRYIVCADFLNDKEIRWLHVTNAKNGTILYVLE